ncbi:arylsulfatase [Planctomycetota bacterium]|nr:arylsulfatase [Planctomycetota bacterium]
MRVLSLILTFVVACLQVVSYVWAKPNVVVIMSDDMGWGQLGCEDIDEVVPTPNIDRIAEEGVMLRNYYVQSVSSPTRAAFLTGRYPFRCGMEERTHGNDDVGMLKDERTVAQAMKESGYSTALFGKWHLGQWQKEHLPMQRGFDHQYGHYSALIGSFDHSRGQKYYDWHRNEKPIYEEGYSSYLIAEEFGRVLKGREREKPFFYYVAYNAVHDPYEAPDELIAKYKDHKLGKQLAMLEGMDISVGRILKSLENEGVLDDTLIVFFNDNGGTRAVGNEPLRGHKGNFYEGGVRVVCMARYPKAIKAGSEYDGLTYVADWYPTLINLGGGSLEQTFAIDGFDIWEGIARGKASEREEIVHCVPGSHRKGAKRAIRLGDYKLVDDELYDVVNDVYETKDLAKEKPEIFAKLEARLEVLVSERRKPEVHNLIFPAPMVYGKLECESVPEWLVKLDQDSGRYAKRVEREKEDKKAMGTH